MSRRQNQPWDRGGARRSGHRQCDVRASREINVMGKRRVARQAALQYHFWRDLHRGKAPERTDDFWELCPAIPRVREFAQPLIEGMIAHLPEIDDRIQRYC